MYLITNRGRKITVEMPGDGLPSNQPLLLSPDIEMILAAQRMAILEGGIVRIKVVWKDGWGKNFATGLITQKR